MPGAVPTTRLRPRLQALVLGPSPEPGLSLPLLLQGTHGNGQVGGPGSWQEPEKEVKVLDNLGAPLGWCE